MNNETITIKTETISNTIFGRPCKPHTLYTVEGVPTIRRSRDFDGIIRLIANELEARFDARRVYTEEHLDAIGE